MGPGVPLLCFTDYFTDCFTLLTIFGWSFYRVFMRLLWAIALHYGGITMSVGGWGCSCTAFLVICFSLVIFSQVLLSVRGYVISSVLEFLMLIPSLISTLDMFIHIFFYRDFSDIFSPSYIFPLYFSPVFLPPRISPPSYFPPTRP